MTLNPSWRTTVAGSAAIIAAVANLVFDTVIHKTVSTEAVGIAITGIMAGIGLLHAKDKNVSNSPIPLKEAQLVTDAPIHAVTPGTTVVVSEVTAPVLNKV